MDRKEFLEKMAVGTGAVVALTVLPACFNEAGAAGLKNKGPVIIDLKDEKNKALATAGGVIYRRGMVIAHLKDGSYAAVTKRCTHAGKKLKYQLEDDRFHCSWHGSSFGADGKILNGPAKYELRQYKVTLEGTKLIIVP